MNEISRKLKSQNLTLNDVKKINEIWIKFPLGTQKKRAPYFLKEMRNQLSDQKIKEIEKMNLEPRSRFVSSMTILEKEIVFTKKSELEQLIKQKIAGHKFEKLDEAIEALLIELKGEKRFLKEIFGKVNSSDLHKIANKAIPNEMANLLF
jgi:hypothetical protein